jgi:hypothetical protein
MILDERTEFADALAVTASAISDVIDLGATPTLRNLGGGESLYLVVGVDTSATAAGAATVTFSLESDSTADLATSATVHYTSAAIGKATLVAGYTAVVVELPSGQYERYLGVRFTVATGPLTAGKFNAFLTTDPSRWQAYADAVA